MLAARRVAVEARVVLKPGAAMAAGFQAPLVDLPLVPPDAGRDPGGLRHHGFQLGAQEVEDRAPRRHRVRDAHDELHVRRRLDQAGFHEVRGVIQHRQVEDFDLRLHVVLEHRFGETFHEVRRVFVDAFRKVAGAGRERRHVGPLRQHRAAQGLLAAAAAGGELHDHAGAMLAHAFADLGEKLGIGTRRFVLLADVDVRDRGAGFERFVRRFDLLGRRDGHRGIVGFAGQRAGDGDGDDDGGGHGEKWLA